MAIYYLNSNSSIEDGLTPQTGFHTFTDLIDNISLNDGDTIRFVEGSTIDDSSENRIIIDKALTLEEFGDKHNKPIWLIPGQVNVKNCSYFKMYDIVIKSSEDIRSIYINGSYEVSSGYTCQDIDIQRCTFKEDCYLVIYNPTRLYLINNILLSVLIDSISSSEIPDIEKAYIINNTFIETTYATGMIVGTNINDLKILNNIIIDSESDIIVINFGDLNGLVDYNFIYNTPKDEFYPDIISGTHNNRSEHPQLRSNYDLKASSPCIDAGIKLDITPEIDYVGRIRPNIPDIGAYEYTELSYYGDLNKTGSGYAGTEEDPLGWDDIDKILQNPKNDSILYLKGYKILTGTDENGHQYKISDSAYTISLYAWNNKLYGPWKLVSDNLLFILCNVRTINNGVLYCTGEYYGGIRIESETLDTLDTIYIYNSILRTTVHMLNINRNISMFGSLVYGMFYYVSGDLTFVDNLIYSTAGRNFTGTESGIQFKNCALSSNIEGDDEIFIDCQRDLTIENLPNWDAEPWEWSISKMGITLNTPPQPGNLPYFGYDTDLWGNTRTGIGGLYYGSVPISITIIEQPKSVSAPFGTSVTFNVVAEGATAYQWKKDGKNIKDATSDTHFIPSVYSSLAGSYSVTLSNNTTKTDSSNAYLTVTEPEMPKEFVPLSGTTSISPDGKKYTIKNIWILDSSTNLPIGNYHYIDL